MLKSCFLNFNVFCLAEGYVGGTIFFRLWLLLLWHQQGFIRTCGCVDKGGQLEHVFYLYFSEH